jgi:cytidylate kinase
MKDKKNIIITISRQWGCGGGYIGEQLAKKLNFNYIDKEILSEAAKILGDEEEVLIHQEERVSSFWENIFRFFSVGTPEAASLPAPLHPILERNLFDTETQIIKKVGDKDNAVIVGRAGFYILRDHPNLIKIFFYASKDFRIKWIKKIYGLFDEKKISLMIKDSDYRRAKFIRNITGLEWIDARNYDLCINTGLVTADRAVEMSIKLVECVRYKLDL